MKIGNSALKWALCGSAAAVALVTVTPSFADGIETVVVTAEKKSENVQTAPLSVTAVTGDELTKSGALNFEDFAHTVPGLNFIQVGGPGQKQLVLRGITTGSGGPSATVGVLVDDIPFGASSSKANGPQLALDLANFDLNRVEVLRGPQGTLYGALSMGGLVKYVPNSPDASDFAASIEAGATSVDHGTTGYDLKGMINIPIVSDTLAVRATGIHEDSPDYIRNIGTGDNHAFGFLLDGGRIAVDFTPSDDFKLELAALAQNIDQNDSPVEDVDRVTHKPVYCDLCRSTVGTPYFKQQYRLYSANADWNLGFGTLTAISSYQTIHSDIRNELSEYLTALGLPPGFAYFSDVNFNTTKETEEVRLASQTGQRLEWLVGLYYNWENTKSPQVVHAVSPTGGFVPPINPLLAYQLPSSFREEAVFGDITYHLTDAFDLSAGVRYSDDKLKFSQTTSGFLSGGASTINGVASDNSTTWMFNARYKFNDEDMLYGRVASGFRPGGANTLNPLSPVAVPRTFGPDKLWNYEIGAKTEWLDGRLLANLSLYWIDWSNIQIGVLTAGINHVENAGEARSRGFEFESKYAATDNLTLGVTASYIDAVLTQLNPGSTLGASVGETLPQTPKWNFSATADYTADFGGGYSGDFGMSYTYVDSRYEAFHATPGVFPFKMRAYGTLDFHAGVALDRYELTLYLKNAADKRGEVQGYTNQAVAPGLPAQLFVTQPRSIGIVLSAKF